MFNSRNSRENLAADGGADDPLSAELLTGNPGIDAEHRQLFALRQTLRSICLDMTAYPTCARCSDECRSLCENRLAGLLGDLLSFILDHFRKEEAIMRESLLFVIDRLICERHMEDHAAISGKIQRIVAALDPLQTVSLLHDVDRLLGQWLASHIACHDMPLVHWIERDDSALRSSI